jgi:hypothetical protein
MRPGEFSDVKTRGQIVLVTLRGLTFLTLTQGPLDPFSVHPEHPAMFMTVTFRNKKDGEKMAR